MNGGPRTPQVGMFPPFGLLDQGSEEMRSFLARAGTAGVSHVCCADHVSFIAGLGFDGLIQATTLATLHPSLPVHTGVYLLPLRHPVLVARQLSDLHRLAPGRLVFGVGIGGEDRHEVEVCGVDPASRGRRMEECLTVVRRLITGEPVTFSGEFFAIENALIRPAAEVPIIVGGRSDTAIRRAGRLGDGWLGIWNSPARFAAAVKLAAEEAERVGRTVAAVPAHDAGLVRPGGVAARGSRSPGVGDGGVLPGAVRAVRALLPVRQPGGRRRVPRAVCRGGLHRVQPHPAVT